MGCKRRAIFGCLCTGPSFMILIRDPNLISPGYIDQIFKRLASCTGTNSDCSPPVIDTSIAWNWTIRVRFRYQPYEQGLLLLFDRSIHIVSVSCRCIPPLWLLFLDCFQLPFFSLSLFFVYVNRLLVVVYCAGLQVIAVFLSNRLPILDVLSRGVIHITGTLSAPVMLNTLLPRHRVNSRGFRRELPICSWSYGSYGWA